MHSKPFTFTDSSGKEIFVYKWVPEESFRIRGVVQIAHGVAEHAKRYERFARMLTGAGLAVYANDHRGHGKTDPDHPGYVDAENGFQAMTDNVRDLSAIVQRNHPDRPYILLGHSMGTTLVLRSLQQYEMNPDGVILSGPPEPPPVFIHAGILLANLISRIFGPDARSPLINQLTFDPYNRAFKPNRTRFDWLSRDEAEVDAYIDDPYCGYICSASFYRDFFRELTEVYKKKNLDKLPANLPFYLSAGKSDPVSGMGKGVPKIADKMRKCGVKNLSLKQYENARHELLNEINREEVMEDWVEWIGRCEM